MRFLKFAALAVLLALPVSSVDAGVIPFAFDGRINEVSFNNYETVLRFNASGTGALTLNGGTYDSVVGDGVMGGDIFVQIYRGGALDIDGAGVTNPFGTSEFTAYSAQTVVGVNANGTLGGLDFGAVAIDPFGILATGEALRLFSDTSLDFTHQSGGHSGGVVTAANLIADVKSATNGDLFASFGFGTALDGGVSNTDTFFSSAIDRLYATTSRNGLDLGSASAGLNTKIATGGLVFGGVFGSDLNLHSIVAQATFSQNVGNLIGGAGNAADYKGARTNGTSNWAYFSDDPFSFAAVPEPATMASFGLIMLAGFAGRRRKMSSK